MKRSDLEAYFRLALESSEMILSNLGRASDLIQRFKQVAVDQSCEEINTFRLKECLENHIMSLRPMLKKGAHSVQLQCHEDVVLKSYAGALGQIISILIMNPCCTVSKKSTRVRFQRTSSIRRTISFLPIVTMARNSKGTSEQSSGTVFHDQTQPWRNRTRIAYLVQPGDADARRPDQHGK